MDKKKVVISFCEAGQGHIVTAQSIAESLESKYGDKIEVVRDYVYRDSGDKVLIDHEKYLVKEVRRANKNRFHQIGRASVGKECVRRCRSRWSPYH